MSDRLRVATSGHSTSVGSSSHAADSFVLRHRGPKAALHPRRAYASLWEEEPDPSGALVPTATIFLTNRECPFRCVMCDLWINTLDERVPRGAIAVQIRRSLAQLPPARQVKLYNAGSFFDPRAIPPEDDDEIAALVDDFERVVVEAHPAFLTGRWGERCVRFARRLRGTLEVAIGLETANPDVLRRLNKRMTLGSFRDASAFLRRQGIALRVFVLLNPPFQPPAEAVRWACLSIDEAVAQGATACSVIPTRRGNGALEMLDPGFEPPRLRALEAVVEYGMARPVRVFADLWNVERLFGCGCSPARAARLAAMNRSQRVEPSLECASCA